MTKFQKRQTSTIAGTSAIPTPETDADVSLNQPTDRLTILRAAIDRQEKELADLQFQIDQLSDDFANRAESIVRLGLQSSYIKARQRIGAIDLSFFGDGAELPHSNNLALMSTIEAEVTT
jgi:hypothetical protein